MKVQKINTNTYNMNFNAKYIIKGSQKEIDSFYSNIKNNIKDINLDEWFLIDKKPAAILIGTDRFSREKIGAMRLNFINLPFETYDSFLKLPTETKLKKIFDNNIKDIKQYDAKNILESMDNFDYTKGIFNV